MCLLFDGWWFFLSRSSPLNNVFVFPSTSASRRLTALFSWIEVFWMLFSTFFVCVFLALIHKQISSALELSALATNVAVHPRTHLTIMSDLLGLYIFFFIFLSVVIFLCEIWIHSSAQLCAPSFRKKNSFPFYTIASLRDPAQLPSPCLRNEKNSHTFFPFLLCVSCWHNQWEEKSNLIDWSHVDWLWAHKKLEKKSKKSVNSLTLFAVYTKESDPLAQRSHSNKSIKRR